MANTKGKHMADENLLDKIERTLGDTNKLERNDVASVMSGPESELSIPKYLLPDKVYDVLKWVGLIVCHALAVFVMTVGNEWGLPRAESVATTIEAIGLLIGMCIKASQLSATELK